MIFPREETTSSGGRGGDNRGNRRRPFRRHTRNDQDNLPDNRKAEQKPADQRAADQRSAEQKSGGQKTVYERPKWVPPRIPSGPLPAPECPYCGKPIRDITSALSDKTGNAVHFDCIIAKISENEILEKGDFIGYIGSGRFGIIRYNNPVDAKKFTIKKVFEWENKDARPQWRSNISENYSIT